MIRNMWLGSTLVLGLCSAIAAQEAPPVIVVQPNDPVTLKPGGGEEAPPTAPQPKPPLKDPTKPDGKLKDILNPQPGTKTAPGAIATGPATYKMPSVTLKARVLAKGRPAAVIEVDGRSYTVAPDVVILTGGLTLRVVEVSATEIRIEVVQLKEVMVLN